MRTLILSVSFLLSTLTAALFITFVLFLGSDISWLNDDVSVVVGSFAFATGTWFTIAQLTFAPFVLLALVLEFTKLSSLMSNLLAGGTCALVALVLYPDFEFDAQLSYAIRDIWVTSIASGFIGGIAHWVIAGHRAGRWIMRKQDTTA